MASREEKISLINRRAYWKWYTNKYDIMREINRLDRLHYFEANRDIPLEEI